MGKKMAMDWPYTM